LCAARAFGLEVADMLEQRGARQLALTPEDWSNVRSMVAHATEIATEVATFAFRAGGASALYESSPLQRIFRDLQAASQHIAASDEAYEYAGQVSLGLAQPHPLLAPRPARASR
jgi:alkylation response protein AidB-like acyl-CoA dehydrogenase